MKIVGNKQLAPPARRWTSRCLHPSLYNNISNLRLTLDAFFSGRFEPGIGFTIFHMFQPRFFRDKSRKLKEFCHSPRLRIWETRLSFFLGYGYPSQNETPHVLAISRILNGLMTTLQVPNQNLPSISWKTLASGLPDLPMPYVSWSSTCMRRRIHRTSGFLE